MGYIEQNLMPGERVVYCARRHPVVFVGPVIVIALLAVSAVAISLVGGRYRAVALAPAGIALAFCMILLERFVAFRTSEFVVTNQRVMLKVGWLHRRSGEILLSKVEAVGVDQSFLGRTFDYGNIVIRGTGGCEEVFRRMRAPLEFRRQTQTLTAQPRRRSTDVEPAESSGAVRPTT